MSDPFTTWGALVVRFRWFILGRVAAAPGGGRSDSRAPRRGRPADRAASSSRTPSPPPAAESSSTRPSTAPTATTSASSSPLPKPPSTTPPSPTSLTQADDAASAPCPACARQQLHPDRDAHPGERRPTQRHQRRDAGWQRARDRVARARPPRRARRRRRSSTTSPASRPATPTCAASAKATCDTPS